MCAASFLSSLVLGLSSVTAQLQSFLLCSLFSLGSSAVLQQLFVLLVPLPVTSLRIIHSYIPHLPTAWLSRRKLEDLLYFSFLPLGLLPEVTGSTCVLCSAVTLKCLLPLLSTLWLVCWGFLTVWTLFWIHNKMLKYDSNKIPEVSAPFHNSFFHFLRTSLYMYIK